MTATTTTEPASKSSVARAFGLKGESWMRHANPVSVWTRFAALPLIALAIWSRDWIGWMSLVPITLSVVWMGINPVFFKKPRSTRNWASKGVLGERIWAEANHATFPAEFQTRATTVAAVLQSAGMAIFAYGLWVLDPIAAVSGLLAVQVGKAWFIDRMVLLFDAMKSGNAEYASWDY
jgi:hypothetical protein